jgi:hypothetical protein
MKAARRRSPVAVKYSLPPHCAAEAAARDAPAVASFAPVAVGVQCGPESGRASRGRLARGAGQDFARVGRWRGREGRGRRGRRGAGRGRVEGCAGAAVRAVGGSASGRGEREPGWEGPAALASLPRVAPQVGRWSTTFRDPLLRGRGASYGVSAAPEACMSARNIICTEKSEKSGPDSSKRLTRSLRSDSQKSVGRVCRRGPVPTK